MGENVDLYEELMLAALQQNREGEFPDWLMTDIFVITADLERYADRSHLVEGLIMQINHFDPYAGTGCFDTSVGVETIRSTIHKILT